MFLYYQGILVKENKSQEFIVLVSFELLAGHISVMLNTIQVINKIESKLSQVCSRPQGVMSPNFR